MTHAADEGGAWDAYIEDDGPKAPRFTLSTISAADLDEIEFPPIKYAVDGILAQGLNLLVGSPKLGKSWFAYGIGIAVASGGVALGRIPVEPGPVLYLALEDTPRRLQSRQRAVLGDGPAPAELSITVECPAMPAGGADAIEEWLVEHPDARLVIVDVLARMRGISLRNDSRYDADYAAMIGFKNLADRYNVAFLVIHHTRKSAGEDFLDSVSGTHGLAGASDAVLVLARARNTAEAVLSITGRDVAEAEYALTFRPEIGTWSLLDEPPALLGLGDTRRRILELLDTEGPMAPKAIADRLGISQPTTRQTIKRMFDADQLDSDGTLYFPVTPVTPVTPINSHRDTRDTCDSDTGEGQ